MNEIINFLNSHASCRKFTGDEITEEQEHLIVNTGRRSPTSSNLQAYSIIGVRDQSKKDRLTKLCGNQAHINESSLFLAFCADLHRLHHVARDRDYPFNGGDAELFIVATVDAALVACRSLMAAQALGLGGVMVGGIRNNPGQVADLLNLPAYTYAVMGMSLGKPKTPPKVKPRLPEPTIYFREQYDDSDFPRCIAEYDKTINEIGYLIGRETQPEKSPNFKGPYTWSEHTARRTALENPKARRLHMLSFLQDRGFLKR